MASIDERIVELAFKGETFLSGVKSSLAALTSLKTGLSGLKDSEKDINNLEQAGKKFSLSGMASGIDAIAGKFKALSIIGITALATIVNQAVFAGLRLAKALTIDPIKAGLDVYETKINAIKTILANTQSEGTNLKQVTAALNQLNTYANKTVFNFGEMTKNIGTFTAAGVNLKTSVESIKGISNLAALSGSSALQASTAMFQLSQAIASGSVKLQDWNSVVNAGLGGKVFQNAILQTAKVNGVAVDAMIKKYGSFRNSLQSGFLTAKILTETLSEFTGDLSAKQIKALGFTDKQTKAIMKQAQAALSSAVQIRTLTQLHQALAEEVATAWSHVWEAIIGNVNDATSTLSTVHTILENALTGPVNNLAKFIEQFNKLGGRDAIVKSIANAFRFLGEVLAPIKDAFREVFPPTSVETVVGIAKAIENFTEGLRVSSKTASDIKSIFEGVFSVFKIAIDVIEAVARGLGIMFGAAASGGGSFLDLAAKIGDFVTNIKDSIEAGDSLTRFFEGLGKVLSFPIKVIDLLVAALSKVPDAISKLADIMQPVMSKISEIWSRITDAIAQGIESGNFQKLGTLLNTLLGGSILLAIRNFIKNLGATSKGGGLFATIKESFEGLTKTLVVMQASLKSDILKKIAIAVALLAASLLVLSFIDPGDLAKSLTALTVMFIQLGAALKVITTVSASAGIVKMAAIGVAINLLAIALVILSGAVAILSRFSWEELTKGLAAIAVLLAELVISTAIMSKNTAGLIGSAFAMDLIAVALNLLAVAVRNLGKLDFGTLAKGIGSIAILLAIIAGFNLISGAQLISTAAAMVIIGAALLVLAKAVEELGSLSIGTIAKGLITITLALVIIAAAMILMTESLLGASALIIVAASLLILAKVLTSLGGMSWEAIAKSLIVLASALGIIAAAMILMTEALLGAAALIVVAASLAILTPVLIALGALSWEAIAKGLVALVGVFVILAAAGIVLTPLVPTLLGLGLAIGLLGIGVLAAGAGVFLFATGLTALAVALTASGAAILSFVKSILDLIPLAAKELGLGIVALANSIGTGGVAIEKAFISIVGSVLDGITKLTPKMAKAFQTVLDAILTAINKNKDHVISTFLNLLQSLLDAVQSHIGRFVDSGASIIIAFLNGISRNINRIASAGTNVIITFINAIGNGTQRIVAAGVDMVIRLVNGIANKIRGSSGELHAAAENLGSAIIEGIISAVVGGAAGLFGALINIAKNAIGAAMHAIHANSPSKDAKVIGKALMDGWTLAVIENGDNVINSMKKTGKDALETLSKTMSSVGAIVSEGINLQPRITPVIDLTQAKAGLSQLSALSKNQLINANASTSFAASISAANQQAAEEAGLSAGITNLNFIQNNTSPKELSASDIYRRTKNQLSIARGALADNANSN
jgi:tape measure domain-containing protein